MTVVKDKKDEKDKKQKVQKGESWKEKLHLKIIKTV